jgi:DNA invertase Pin-like site-specific DNA recombinase
MFNFSSQPKRAIAYYRHSAEDKQENSVLIQREHTKKFAEQHTIEIIHEESDEGKSGLLASRPGFDKLFNNWILNPNAPEFNYILVYDVSRWGRFQDPDEAAYYEMLGKKRGKTVIYVTRGFPIEEQKLLMSLQTPIERYMAADYSRNLSNKVFHGSVKVSEQGYSAGGSAPYGLTRVLLDENKNQIRNLKTGERKIIANQRVTSPQPTMSQPTLSERYSLYW